MTSAATSPELILCGCFGKPTKTDAPFGRLATRAQPAPQQPRTAARKMIDPAKYCGCAWVLDRFIAQIKRRFDTQPQQFYGGKTRSITP